MDKQRHILDDKFELVEVVQGNERALYSGPHRVRAVRLCEYWRKFKPDRSYRIDRLVRMRGEGE